ncbi:hypothetical protein [Microbispora amethystogenes]|uniref:Uncharacterized protein n=1 Tax=Microbispora amethystogenes TaxID=1427754 RepID=A0ABQ4FI17_9ACTN|nr:hypothetical protein [Microbispora amethystogenes]GIH34474.1 hypothetical protein Mam01_46380 [Microbispora amethystogenes]
MDAESTICLSDLVPALRWSRPQQVAEMLADPRLPGGWWASVTIGHAVRATGVDWLCERLARLAVGRWDHLPLTDLLPALQVHTVDPAMAGWPEPVRTVVTHLGGWYRLRRMTPVDLRTPSASASPEALLTTIFREVFGHLEGPAGEQASAPATQAVPGAQAATGAPAVPAAQAAPGTRTPGAPAASGAPGALAMPGASGAFGTQGSPGTAGAPGTQAGPGAPTAQPAAGPVSAPFPQVPQGTPPHGTPAPVAPTQGSPGQGTPARGTTAQPFPQQPAAAAQGFPATPGASSQPFPAVAQGPTGQQGPTTQGPASQQGPVAPASQVPPQADGAPSQPFPAVPGAPASQPFPAPGATSQPFPATAQGHGSQGHGSQPPPQVNGAPSQPFARPGAMPPGQAEQAAVQPASPPPAGAPLGEQVRPATQPFARQPATALPQSPAQQSPAQPGAQPTAQSTAQSRTEARPEAPAAPERQPADLSAHPMVGVVEGLFRDWDPLARAVAAERLFAAEPVSLRALAHTLGVDRELLSQAQRTAEERVLLWLRSPDTAPLTGHLFGLTEWLGTAATQEQLIAADPSHPVEVPALGTPLWRVLVTLMPDRRLQDGWLVLGDLAGLRDRTRHLLANKPADADVVELLGQLGIRAHSAKAWLDSLPQAAAPSEAGALPTRRGPAAKPAPLPRRTPGANGHHHGRGGIPVPSQAGNGPDAATALAALNALASGTRGGGVPLPHLVPNPRPTSGPASDPRRWQRIDVTSGHLRGEPVAVPEGYAAQLGMRPGTLLSVTGPGNNAVVLVWRDRQPVFDSLQPVLMRLNARPGDSVYVTVDGYRLDAQLTSAV